MSVAALCVAGAVLVATLAAGTIVHELSHAAVLRLFGVDCRLEWLPDRDGEALLRAGAVGTWAQVTLQTVPTDLSPWVVRAAAVMPLALAIPFALVLVGVLPDAVVLGDPALTAASIAWLACALPSPADFSLFWHAEAALDSLDGEGRDGW